MRKNFINYPTPPHPSPYKGEGEKIGQALVYVLVLIALIGIAMRFGLELSDKFSLSTKSKIAHSELQGVTDQILDQIIDDAKKSMSYIAQQRGRLNATQLQKFIELYRDPTRYNEFLNIIRNPPAFCNDASTYPCVTLYPGKDFLDVVRASGYRSERKISVDGIQYEYSIRCLKDESKKSINLTEYNQGTFDGCPLTPRAEWTNLDIVGQLPKKVEVVLQVQKDGHTFKVQEISELTPTLLSDYSLAISRINPIDVNNPLTIFPGNQYGRWHFDEGNLSPYELKFDARAGNAIFTRPFTTSGLDSDIFRLLEGVSGVEVQGINVNSNGYGIYFRQGYSKAAPRLNIENSINQSLEIIRNESEAIVTKILSSNCRLTPIGTPSTSIRISECTNSAFNNSYPLSENSITTFYFSDTVKMDGGVIKYSLSIFSNKDIHFYGLIHYALSDNTTYQNKIFVPYFPRVAELTDPNPLEIRPSGVDSFRSFLNTQNPYAMWVAKENIVFKVNQIKPLIVDSQVSNGTLYKPASDSTTLLQLSNSRDGGRSSYPTSNMPYVALDNDSNNNHRQSSSSSSSNFFYRISVLDGKIQAGGTLLIDPLTLSPPTPTKNLGALILRGGLAVGTNPTLKLLYGCSPNCFIEGFNNVLYLFDSRPGFRRIPGQVGTYESAFIRGSLQANTKKNLFGLTNAQFTGQ